MYDHNIDKQSFARRRADYRAVALLRQRPFRGALCVGERTEGASLHGIYTSLRLHGHASCSYARKYARSHACKLLLCPGIDVPFYCQRLWTSQRSTLYVRKPNVQTYACGATREDPTSTRKQMLSFPSPLTCASGSSRCTTTSKPVAFPCGWTYKDQAPMALRASNLPP